MFEQRYDTERSRRPGRHDGPASRGNRERNWGVTLRPSIWLFLMGANRPKEVLNWWLRTGSTYRPSAFQKVCRFRRHRVSINQSAQLERIHPGSQADVPILTLAP